MTYSGTILEDLAWQVEAGADEALGEVAGLINWQARIQSPPSLQMPSAPLDALRSAPIVLRPVPEKKAAQALVAPPALATTLAELQTALQHYDGCDLKQTAINLVFADGNPLADLMIIGDAPAEEEDRQGIPFVGPEGQLLDKMLAAIGLGRGDVYLTNLVFWRPPGNRTPTDVEIAACLPFTEQHIRLKKPKMLVLLGATVTKTLLHNRETFSKMRGQWASYTPHLGGEALEPIPCLPIYHPSYLLRQPSAKRQAWVDLLRLQKELAETIPLKYKE